MKSRLFSTLSWLVTLLIPLALIGLAVRVVLIPAYLQVEYRMPYFPPDDYGFTTQDRLHWAPYAWKYLLNNADVSYLGILRFPDGSALFNERELSHMQDVKRVIGGALKTWYASLLLLALLGLWAWRGDRLPAYRQGLRRGGWLMVSLAVAIGVIVVAGISLNPDVFWEFFTFFHSLFFKGDSWLFAYSDTLIRLFPIRFWQDTFLFAALIALGGGLGLGLGLPALVDRPGEPHAASTHDV